jgi:hypothetical protein
MPYIFTFSLIFRLRFLFFSRLFTLAKFYSDLLIWKGIWGIGDNVIGGGWQVSVSYMVSGWIILAPFGGLRAIFCTPVGKL